MPVSQQAQQQYQGVGPATKRNPFKGAAIGASPSDNLLQGAGQAAASGRGTKKHMSLGG